MAKSWSWFQLKLKEYRRLHVLRKLSVNENQRIALNVYAGRTFFRLVPSNYSIGDKTFFLSFSFLLYSLFFVIIHI